jgi:hypothetical protein
MRTASLLGQAVENKLADLLPTTSHPLKVIVRVYANMKGLAWIYKELDILREDQLDEFVRGFNMGNIMCDFVDAGNGKECADKKVGGRSHYVEQVSQVFVSTDITKRLSSSVWTTSTVNRFSLGARPTADTPVCFSRTSRTRYAVGGSLCSKDPPLPKNWPTSRTDSVRSSSMCLGARSYRPPSAECRPIQHRLSPLAQTTRRLLQSLHSRNHRARPLQARLWPEGKYRQRCCETNWANAWMNRSNIRSKTLSA